jgi:putative pyruvate formate lyase activating enzyme
MNPAAAVAWRIGKPGRNSHNRKKLYESIRRFTGLFFFAGKRHVSVETNLVRICATSIRQQIIRHTNFVICYNSGHSGKRRNFPMDNYPGYLKKYKDGTLQTLADRLLEGLQECTLCPHLCRVNRYTGERGYCKAAEEAEVSGYGPHFGEEPPLVGVHGSGTIFFSHCNLGCVFCQNWETSHGEGEKVSFQKLGEIMLELQAQRCHNINLVTPSHYVPQIVAAVAWAATKGLHIPLVYNCSGYERWETLHYIDGLIDIYMPDFKYADPVIGRRFSNVSSYWDVAKTALKEMHRQVGDLAINEQGAAYRGLIIRHLVLPAQLAGTQEIMDFVAEEISPNSYINIMDQYFPEFKARCYSELNRRITRTEFREAVHAAKKASSNFRLAHESVILA